MLDLGRLALARPIRNVLRVRFVEFCFDVVRDILLKVGRFDAVRIGTVRPTPKLAAIKSQGKPVLSCVLFEKHAGKSVGIIDRLIPLWHVIRVAYDRRGRV